MVRKVLVDIMGWSFSKLMHGDILPSLYMVLNFHQNLPDYVELLFSFNGCSVSLWCDVGCYFSHEMVMIHSLLFDSMGC